MPLCVTATSFSGDGSQLTGIDATQIQTGNTSVQTVDTGSNGHVKITTEGTERLRITSAGNVGIGTDNPVNARLEVYNTSMGNLAQFRSFTGTAKPFLNITSSEDGVTLVEDGAAYRSIMFKTGAAERLRINASGNVGIGTNNPAELLDVEGNSEFGGRLKIRRRDSDTSAALLINNAAGSVNQHIFYGNGTVSLTGSKVQIDTSGNIDLRSSGGNLFFDAGKGISFADTTQHAGMSSELLDDYEEGVYAATLTCGSGSITLNSNIQNLAYTRIGRLVHVQGFISVSSVSSPSGTVLLSVPFTIDVSLSQNSDNGTSAIQVMNAGVDADRWTLNVGTGSGMYIVRTNRQNPTATDAGSSFSGDESINMSFTFITS